MYIRDDYDDYLLLKKPPRYHTRLFGLKLLFLKRKIYFVVFSIGNVTTRIAS